MAPKKVSITERLERNSIPEPNSGCVLWLGAVSGTSRHGRMKNNKRTVSPHRIAFIEKHGPIPTGLDVLHSCDVPSCINPDHLRLGTHADNMADMVSRERAARLAGAINGNSRLSSDQALIVLSSEKSHAALAREMGVSETAIRQIRQRLTWRHLKAPSSGA